MTDFNALRDIPILIGAFFVLTSAIGIVRFPDLYSRLHASSKLVTLGSAGIFLGAALSFQDSAAFTRLLAVLIFQFLTTPLTAYLIAQAAYLRGLPPHLPGGDPAERPDHRGPARLLALGLVRGYKGIDVLMRAMLRVPGVTITVAGEIWGDAGDEIRRLAEHRPRERDGGDGQDRELPGGGGHRGRAGEDRHRRIERTAGALRVTPGESDGEQARIVGKAIEFPEWVTCRAPWQDRAITLRGDSELGARFLSSLNVV